jgi:hypothetical protein
LVSRSSFSLSQVLLLVSWSSFLSLAGLVLVVKLISLQLTGTALSNYRILLLATGCQITTQLRVGLRVMIDLTLQAFIPHLANLPLFLFTLELILTSPPLMLAIRPLLAPTRTTTVCRGWFRRPRTRLQINRALGMRLQRHRTIIKQAPVRRVLPDGTRAPRAGAAQGGALG